MEIVLIVLVIAAVALLVLRSKKNSAAAAETALADAKADARQSIERLGGHRSTT